MMARPKHRSQNLTHEQKRLICLHSRQFPKTTQAQLGEWAKKQFKLDYVPSQAAMSYMLKKRLQFELISGEGRDQKKLRTVKCPEVDSALANWFLYCQARQLKLPGDLREEGELDIFDVPLQKVVEWVAAGWQQIPRSRIMASFAQTGVATLTENGNEVVPDNRADEKLDAQIQLLLKRLKPMCPLRLIEVVAPSAERACDEDLTDADFADSALHTTQGSTGMAVRPEDVLRHTQAMQAADASLENSFDPQELSASRRSTNSFATNSDFPGFEQGYPGSVDDNWLAWSTSQRTIAGASVQQPASDLEAVQTVIRLATEMNCDPTFLAELNRIQTAVANRGVAASTPITNQTAPQNVGVCQFKFGASTKRLI
ncbi:hypothetical protein PHYBOEH_007712 [Phytophthora boehmeriae]|uniref:DDE-1 domain-containing protein n=1 Tax=Phytophthora boehmeriae TaxID=109152 RepID=A0A8T1X2R6_9STRA|nr:hypothetical protein PHYBOEH_007712 [Phytophthora boehmeriae]